MEQEEQIIFLMLPIKFEIENICCFNFNIYERLGLGHEIVQKSSSDRAKIAIGSCKNRFMHIILTHIVLSSNKHFSKSREGGWVDDTELSQEGVEGLVD